MTPPSYRTGAFAQRAGVSVRTLRFYDREGLLTPAAHSESGHRRYSDEDLITLQKILAMKLLGFTLGEIRAYLAASPQTLSGALAQQRAMLCERRDQIDRAIQTIDEVDARLREDGGDWAAFLRVIEVMKMNEDRSWVEKHLTPEQIAAIQEIAGRAYSPEAAERLAARAWTEEDQVRASRAWAEVGAEAERLATTGADPAGTEAQALVARQEALIGEFTQGDPEVAAGLARFYEEARDLPAERSPYPGSSPAVQEFMDRAYAAREAS
ncbi:MAG: MerR family transcriptional regulator [Fimbriimonas sp.]